ncbi:MAG: sigma-70 family RNA polymerase sigma factor [Anaerohalosphaera sp.]|nr:sigma-70 family RNA polymerase sigma factor [Anaerohalosphaera sp.]
MKDKSVYLSLLSSHYCKLHAYVLCMTTNVVDTDDILQDVALVMWEKFEEYEPGTDFVAWAKAIARYKILNFRKKQGRLKLQLDEKVIEYLHKDGEIQNNIMDDKLAALKSCIKKLPRNDKVIVKFMYFEKKSVKQIALSIGVSLHSTYRKISKIHSILLGCVQRTIRSGESM